MELSPFTRSIFFVSTEALNVFFGSADVALFENYSIPASFLMSANSSAWRPASAKAAFLRLHSFAFLKLPLIVIVMVPLDPGIFYLL